MAGVVVPGAVDDDDDDINVDGAEDCGGLDKSRLGGGANGPGHGVAEEEDKDDMVDD